MSMEISLSRQDYKIILTWFELAFAKTNDISAEDNATFRKITVMGFTNDENEIRKREDN